MRVDWERAAIVVAILAVGYLGVATMVYRFAHPRMTETELFLHIPDALLWKADAPCD